MVAPSIPLLRALRATEAIRSTLPLRQQPPNLPKRFSSHSPSPYRRSPQPPQTTNVRSHARGLSTTPTPLSASSPPTTTDRGPASTEPTQTDFSAMDVFSNAPAPTASIDACLSDGFHLDNGVKITGGAGLLLVSGEAFAWRPWEGGGRGRLLNSKGQWDTGEGAWGVLGLVWPKPDLLILGLGPGMYPIAPETRRYINDMGIRIDVQDTRNAAAQFNLLATERGVGNVACALIPIGWREPK
ncbi:hypothetical protein HO173_008486 [Letharia columbiana]|uniref:NADH dehydrogenase [ubiquinone] 1 alpha subcomplex assembly factor 3 n=1 Tax=Letharia columbiana TaxID=112416 RepID=A0A8H6FR73_9LECA|nr:uncharacterized protein HO173_008486 [Letharia columbiana]KAF6233197.1 hypothetical protein HO173_008486 [Letharia columbiana]